MIRSHAIPLERPTAARMGTRRMMGVFRKRLATTVTAFGKVCWTSMGMSFVERRRGESWGGRERRIVAEWREGMEVGRGRGRKVVKPFVLLQSSVSSEIRRSCQAIMS